MAERNGTMKIALVATLTLLVGLIGGYAARRGEATPAYSAAEIDGMVKAIQIEHDGMERRLTVSEKYADEYRRDVSQINSRIAVIESKVTTLLEKKGG